MSDANLTDQESSNTNSNSSFSPKSFLDSCTTKPGVYQMFDDQDTVIYVGKAKNLKNRLNSYFQKNLTQIKTRALVSHITKIELIVTHTEKEALILENNLIKKFMPKYNICFRDDKSYPYIYVSTEHQFPRLRFHRGARKGKGKYFGPYPSAGATRETLQIIQKIFPVRQCEDTFYKNRSRPCLQYQIKRCSAPCVGLVSEESYQEEVAHVILFLEGKNKTVINQLVDEMDRTSGQLDYEKAALYRDQIIKLRKIQEKQYITQEQGDLDIISSACSNGVGCVQVFLIRGGRNLGNKTYYPKMNKSDTTADMLQAFIPQYYLKQNLENLHAISSEIIISESFDSMDLMTQVLSEQAGRKIAIKSRVRGDRVRWLKMSVLNVANALQTRISSNTTILKRYENLAERFQLDDLPNRMECFDISHTSGERTVASCVVFDINGPVKSEYRRFKIENITPGDDYAAIKQALTRRYTRIKNGEEKLPDILFVDGGKGQLTQAEEVLENLQIENILLIGISKGPERKAGEETILISNKYQFGISENLSINDTTIILPSDSMASHLIQHIRDEAHRFAITGHRQSRAKARKTSVLEQIAGLGPKRRQSLLKQFGGLQEIKQAGIDELKTVSGISLKLAEQIYNTFHSNESNEEKIN
ncbi:MAG: excinuclease ABC subunit UvrC [Gammaproteobacteria bacterium]